MTLEEKDGAEAVPHGPCHHHDQHEDEATTCKLIAAISTREKISIRSSTRIMKFLFLAYLVAASSESTSSSVSARELQQPFSYSDVTLQEYEFYDKLYQTNSQNITRVGTVEVLSPTSYDPSAQETIHSELAYCHIAALWRYSTLERQSSMEDENRPANLKLGLNQQKTSNVPQPVSLGPSYYGDSAGALLAIHHFNHGIGTIVPELTNIHQTCNIRLSVEFLDSFSSKPRSVQQMTQAYGRLSSSGLPRPCAVLGAYRSAVTAALAVLTGVYELPQISHSSTSPDLENSDLYPLFSRVVPSDAGTSLLTVQHLLQHNVTHVAVLNVDDTYGTSYKRAFTRIAEAHGITVRDFEFAFGGETFYIEVKEAIRGMKETGYNYFFGIMFGKEHYNVVMTEAYNQGIAGNADRRISWIFAGGVDRHIEQSVYEEGSALDLATRGIGVIQADGGQEGMEGFEKFQDIWQGLDEEDVKFINSKQPPDDPTFNYSYYKAPPDYFQTNHPQRATRFAYDAVVALGLAACQASNATNHNGDGYFDGVDHLDHFLQTDFTGATGHVRFNATTHSRDPRSSSYVLLNILPVSKDEGNTSATEMHYKLQTSAVFLPSEDSDIASSNESATTSSWQPLPDNPFVFSDGSTVPPPSLAPYPHNLNHIGAPLRAIGYTVASFIMFLSLLFAGWTYKLRKDRVVRASQPIFLMLICAGTFLMGLSIVPLSLDDEVVSTEGASKACMSVPWLYSVGYVLAFSALFSKTWRINKIFLANQMRRIKVTPKDVIAPLVLLMTLNVVMLTTWTFLNPLNYVRVVNDTLDEHGRPTSSFGICTTATDRSAIVYIVLLLGADALALIFACFQAYRARHISTEYSESRYVGMAMASILQAFVIGVPLIILTHRQPTASYFVEMSLIATTALSVLLLIFLPKMRRREKRKRSSATDQTNSNPSNRGVPGKFARGGTSKGAYGGFARTSPGPGRASGAVAAVTAGVPVGRQEPTQEGPLSAVDVSHSTQTDDDKRAGVRVVPSPMSTEVHDLRSKVAAQDRRLDALATRISSLISSAADAYDVEKPIEVNTNSGDKERAESDSPTNTDQTCSRGEVAVTQSELEDLLNLATGKDEPDTVNGMSRRSVFGNLVHAASRSWSSFCKRR